MRTYWHNPAVRAAAAVAEGWRAYEEVYRPCEWSPDFLATVQQGRIKDILLAARSAPRYRGLALATRGSPLDVITALPVLEKRTLIHDPDSIRTGLLSASDVIKTRTSGTTGEPIVIEHDERRFSEAFASHLRMLAAYGVEPPHRSLRFTADQRHQLIDFDYQPLTGLELCLRVNASKITCENARYVFGICRDFRPTTITGQPLEVLLGCTRSVQFAEPLPKVALVITHGDTLDDNTSKALTQIIGSPHCDVYGLQETGKVAWGCPEQPGRYHIEEEKVLCEVEDDGLLLLSSLVNRAMMLLRYRSGDGCSPSLGRCPCGRASRVVTGLRGRQRGFVLDRNESPIAIKGLRLYLESLPVGRWQFVQAVPGEACLRLSDPLPNQHGEIAKRLREIGNLADVRIETVTMSDLMTPTGKAPYFRLIVDQRRLAAQLTGADEQVIH